jgi:hypothetical protein
VLTWNTGDMLARKPALRALALIPLDSSARLEDDRQIKGIRPSHLLSIAAVSILAAGGLAAGLAGAKRPALPDLVVAKIFAPRPPGTKPGSTMSLRAVIQNRGGARARPSRVAYFLSVDRRLGAGDIPLEGRLQRVAALRPGRSAAGATRGAVPASTKAGLRYLIACVDVTRLVKETRERNNCAASRWTLAIQAPSGKPGPPRGGEGYPTIEFTADPTWIRESLKCPLSLHGQSGSDCVWVENVGNQTISPTDPAIISPGLIHGLFYCPKDHPYPFEVALGFDPLWIDKSISDVERIGTVSGTKYSDGYSFAGTEGVGYVWVELPVWNNFYPDKLWVDKVEYLCSDVIATSYLP